MYFVVYEVLSVVVSDLNWSSRSSLYEPAKRGRTVDPESHVGRRRRPSAVPSQTLVEHRSSTSVLISKRFILSVQPSKLWRQVRWKLDVETTHGSQLKMTCLPSASIGRKLPGVTEMSQESDEHGRTEFTMSVEGLLASPLSGSDVNAIILFMEYCDPTC